MPGDADPILEAVTTLRGTGIEAELCGEGSEHWRIGDFLLDDATLLRLAHEAVTQRLMARLKGFAQGLGLDVETTRHIINRVIADMPLRPDEDRLARARNWVLVASA